MSPTPAPLPTTAEFDAALGAELLALLEAHDVVRTEVLQLMREVRADVKSQEFLPVLRATSEHLKEVREALARALRRRRKVVVRADVARPESVGASAPS